MASIELTHVCKTYRNARARAVDGISLSVSEGEFVVIVGPSGCGKTTLLRLIAGLEAPDAGKILIMGRDMRGVAPKDRGVAMALQSAALYPHLSVRENLAFSLRQARTSSHQIDQLVNETAQCLSIRTLLDRSPHELSGGERQRVALGRAIVRRPKALLLDEPLSSLDAALRADAREVIRRAHAHARCATVFVTHDQDDAMYLGDRVVVLVGGRVVQDASPQDLLDQPANRVVAEFIGTPAMNMLEGALAAAGECVAFVTSSGESVLLHGVDLVRADGPAVLGVRPGAIELCSAGVPGTVKDVRRAGDFSDVVISTCGDTIVSRTFHAGVAVGERVHWRIAPGKAHVFGPVLDGSSLGETLVRKRA